MEEIKNADKKVISKYIKEKCYTRAKQIYGENLPHDVEKRLKLELDSIIENNFEIKYLVTSEVAKKSKKLGYLSYTRGSVGNSFVAFLLEITDFNPIKYNLPFEMFAGIKYDKEPDIEIYISEEIIEKILDEVKDVKEEIKIRGTNLPTFFKKLQDKTKINPQDIDFEDKDTLNLFAKAETRGVFDFSSDFMINMLKKVKIKNFNDLVCVSALSHGTGTWNQNAEYLIKELDIPIDKLVSNRADIMNYLIENDIDIKTAYEITEFIRKGKAYKANDIFDYSDLKAEFQAKWEEYRNILEKHRIPPYYIDSCEKIKYLFPKSHSITNVENAFRLAWYKTHYPEAFFKTYFEIYKTVNINYYYTKSEVKNKLKKLYDERFGSKKENYKLKNLINDFEILLEMFEKGIKKDEKRNIDDYDLINSKAIGDYCREIGHKFNTEELAVLVYRNKKMDIKEKIEKYQDLIDNYPDMEVVERINCKHYDSVKTLIQNEINRIKSTYEEFIKEDKNCIYAWNDWNKEYGYSHYDIDDSKRTYKEMENEINNLIEEYDEINYFTIKKKYFNEKSIVFSNEERMISMNYHVINKVPKLIEIYESDAELLDIEGIFVNIPVPFKKGDILKNESTIFALNSLTIWDERMNTDLIRNIDTTDMSGNGYILDEDTPQFVLDHVLDYDSFEFYDGKLEGNNRILKLISSFLKGKIDNLELFIRAYESFKFEYKEKMPNIFIDADLKLAGFKDWDISKINKENKKIYLMEDEEKMEYIRRYTNGLSGISEENIKQIETNFDNDVFVLTKNGALYKNGTLIDKKIMQIHMFDGLHLYKLTSDNGIRPIEENQKWDEIDRYLNNKDCSYKKVLMSVMNIIALTNDGEIREIHQYPACIVPENYIGVQDIKIKNEEGLDVPYILKENKYVKLYVN